MKFSFRPKILDIVALLLGISAILLVSLSVYSNSGDVSYVYITGEKGEWIEPLGTNKEIDVAGTDRLDPCPHRERFRRHNRFTL